GARPVPALAAPAGLGGGALAALAWSGRGRVGRLGMGLRARWERLGWWRPRRRRRGQRGERHGGLVAGGNEARNHATGRSTGGDPEDRHRPQQGLRKREQALLPDRWQATSPDSGGS